MYRGIEHMCVHKTYAFFYDTKIRNQIGHVAVTQSTTYIFTFEMRQRTKESHESAFKRNSIRFDALNRFFS